MINGAEHLTHFEFMGEVREVKFVQTDKVAEGVECDVYEFVGNPEEDLGIIRVAEGMETPKQRVNLDLMFPIEFTEEGLVSGEGEFRVDRFDGLAEAYVVNPETGRFSTLVDRGDEMQWRAGKGGLVAYEVCKPPYKDGRFINLD